jgi:hypothetical protein
MALLSKIYRKEGFRTMKAAAKNTTSRTFLFKPEY